MPVTSEATANTVAEHSRHGCVGSEALVPCFRCGLCCTGRHVRLSRTDARRIADGLGITLRDFHERYIDPLWAGTGSLVLRQREGRCVFLRLDDHSHVATCLIHPFKPTICRMWTPGLHRRECREGMASRQNAAGDPSSRPRRPVHQNDALATPWNPW